MGNSEDEKQARDEEVRRRIKIFMKNFEEGNIQIDASIFPKIEESLLKIRVDTNGEIDLATVDGRVRVMALAITAMQDRQDMKKSMSLAEIQNLYFEIIEKNFCHFYEVMIKKGLNPHSVGMSLIQQQDSVEEIMRGMDGFLEMINEFWDQTGEIAQAHVEDMSNSKLKGIFGGDLFPDQSSNIASKCGIYIDTIVLPDPFLRSHLIFSTSSREDKVYYLVKHAMNILQYKKMACLEIEQPIVVVLPDFTVLREDEMKFVQKISEADSLNHANKVFGRKFNSSAELMEYAKKLGTIDAVIGAIKDETRVLFDAEWDVDIRGQIEGAMDGREAKLLGTRHPGILVAAQSIGRMTVSNELMIKASQLKGTPIIDAPTSWKYFVWKMEYDSNGVEQKTGLKDLHVVRGLQGLGDNQMEWLGNVPPDALIEMRKQGAIDEIRNTLTEGIGEIVRINPASFNKSRDKILENIIVAFADHKQKIRELREKKWKFAGKDIGSWFVTGSMAVTAACTGMPVWGIAAFIANQVMDAPKLKDIPKSFKKLVEEDEKNKRSPVGMLFDVSKQEKK
ncbi:hypothetical protein K8S19_01595 [bacterium]|nr:hypothetical protein [bacterium]